VEWPQGTRAVRMLSLRGGGRGGGGVNDSGLAVLRRDRERRLWDATVQHRGPLATANLRRTEMWQRMRRAVGDGHAEGWDMDLYVDAIARTITVARMEGAA
jgi:uncharacterized protein with von Willebrand factor type A (vWA) domain